MHVKAMNDDVAEFNEEVATRRLDRCPATRRGTGKKPGVKLVVEPESCDFTKENFAAKPDLNSPEAQDGEQEEEFCDNCGRTMVLRNGPWDRSWPARLQRRPAVQDDPQAHPEGADEAAGRAGRALPKCGKPLLQRDGSMASSSPARAIRSAST